MQPMAASIRHRHLLSARNASHPDTTVSSPSLVSRVVSENTIWLSNRRRWRILATAAVTTACYAAYFLIGTPPGDPTVKAQILSTLPAWYHVVGGMLSMAIGPFQLLISYGKQPRPVHRWMGLGNRRPVRLDGFQRVSCQKLRVCVVGHCVDGHGGVWTANCVAEDYGKHREWMLRNFALTYAAVMLRWQLPLFIALGNSSAGALTATAFTCWIPNLVFAEWWIRRKSGKMVQSQSWGLAVTLHYDMG